MISRRIAPWNTLWLVLAAVFFLLPLFGTAEFSLETGPGRYGFAAYGRTFADPQFSSTFLFSLQLALATVVLSTLLMVPTVFWVHLRLPRLRRVMDFIAVLPFVVPPVTLAVGVLHLFNPIIWISGGPQILVLSYVVLALPFTYRSLDAGMRALDLRTLTEAAQSLGAGWIRILISVLLPNLRAAMLSAAFLTITLVMGEFTMAAIMSFNTFPTYVYQIGNEQAQQASALAVVSLLLTWAALLLVLLLGRSRGRRRQAQIGGAH
jgi:putative spermidine/putrescine transport system permease protein